jgi:predicted nucleotide-binding protein (sugar kinase/HSP70/actin superfamily)
VVEEIIECSGTPYFSFKDLDENRPAGSIKIRVETISYFLKRYREDRLREAWRERTAEQATTQQHQAPPATDEEIAAAFAAVA